MPRRKNAKRQQPRKPIRKYQRKQRAKSRMPFVEQKQKDETLSRQLMFQGSETSKVYIPSNFTLMSQGDGIDQMNGRWIYSKWISTRMHLAFDNAVDYNFPLNVRCRYGWCKLNLNWSLTTGGTGTPLSVGTGELQSHVEKVLTNNYDDSTLLPQKARDVLTLGDFMIKNNPRILEDSSTGDIVSFRNDKHLKFKWSPQRKIQYQKCQDPTTSTTYFQCNQKNWIPFVHFIRVQSGNEAPPTDAEMPTLDIGTRHYFTDA